MINKLKNLDGKNLMILDDAKKDFSLIRKFLPGKPNWNVLITSRQNFSGVTSYYLNFLSRDAALELFYKYYTQQKNDELVDAILKPVGYHTLVVELFAKMAENNGLSLKELSQRADSRGIDISTDTKIELEHTKKIVTHILKYLQKTFPIANMPGDKTTILRKLAIIPSEFYSAEIIEFFLQIEDEKREKFCSNLNGLVEMGWIEKSDNNYKLHDILRQLILKDFPPIYEYYEDYIRIVTILCNVDDSKDNIVEKIPAFLLGVEVLKYIKELNKVTSALTNNLAVYYYKDYKGNYLIARDLLETALQSDMENFGEKHPTVAVSQSNLATVYKNLGEYDKARELLEVALKSDLENFGEKHPTVAVSQSNLATVYKNLGEYEKARDLLEAALKSDMENFEEKHPTVAVSQSNLAGVYQELGEYEKARDLLEAALQSTLENFGEKHPTVAVSQSNLAGVYQDLGEYKKARELLEVALKSGTGLVNL
ncbi:MAG: tetratricopeptide repeat protein [Candidatus Cloacimonetes bacterium]|nr:tetratricopeptide repeat protein [Candidatus Cloacimonadota bacterium]